MVELPKVRQLVTSTVLNVTQSLVCFFIFLQLPFIVTSKRKRNKVASFEVLVLFLE